LIECVSVPWSSVVSRKCDGREPLSSASEADSGSQSASRRLGAVRDALNSGRPEQVIELGRTLASELTDPSDQATLHLLMGGAELLNGRIAPAMQRFRLADLGDLSKRDQVQIGVWEAFSRYGAGGIAAVEAVVDELEANSGDDLFMRSSVLGLRAWISMERGQSTQAVETALAARALSSDLNDPDMRVLAHLLVAMAHSGAGQVDPASAAVAAGIESAVHTGHTTALPILNMVGGDLDHIRGRLHHSLRHARTAIASSEPISAGLIGVWGHGQMAVVADRLGDDDAAANHVVNAERALLRGAPIGWGHLAIARLRLGRQDDAERNFQRLIDVWRYLADQGSSSHPQMLALPSTDFAGRQLSSASLNELLARLGALNPTNPVDSLSRDLAVAALRDDLGVAIELAEALTQTRSTHLTMVGDALAIVADLAARLVDRRSRSYADDAREVYTSIGAHGDLRRLIARHPEIARGDSQVMTPAERRVVSLVIDGLSNAEIAGELFLSVKTVESHLAKVYRRFGVKSRTQLVSYLRQLPD
jgi:DNA-binding CsgD family transcriptional regulator